MDTNLGRWLVRHLAWRPGHSRARAELLAMVGHDLRAPATTLVAGAELLAGDYLAEAERHDVLATMIHEGDRLRRLVDDLLLVESARGGHLPICARPVELRPLLAGAVAALGRDPDRPVQVDLERDLWVMADPGRLEQVLSNLLCNARKYSPEAGLIRLTARELGGAVEISVTDRGIGVPRGAVRHLFDPYYRSPGATARGIRGTGLGLAIVKSIVEGHGGQVGVESDGPGRGARVWFTLKPAQPQSAALIRDVTPTTSAREIAA